MKKIELTQGQYALVDDADFEWLNRWKWCATWDTKLGNFYAMRNAGYVNGKQKNVKMHRLIMNFPKGKQVDHVSHNTLDNRRENLRICTRAENQHNAKRRSDNSSGYKGVRWHKKSQKWQVQIAKNKEYIHIGLFGDPIEAAKAYDIFARKLHGEFAYLNF